MRKATRIVTLVFGLFAGAASIEHGIFEILQGNVKPESLMIASMGPPCQPEEIWNACEPAMTILPNFLITGIIATLIGCITLIWILVFLRKKVGGLVLIVLSILMLPFGGGIFPPLIGIIGGIVGMKINAPISEEKRVRAGSASRFLARLWPWPLVLFMTWLLGQWVIGYFFNDFLLNNGIALILILIPALMALTVLTSSAYDVHDAKQSQPTT